MKRKCLIIYAVSLERKSTFNVIEKNDVPWNIPFDTQ